MAADTLDVLTLAEATAAVGARAGEATLLETYVTGVSRMMDRWFGAVVRRTVTAELHDGGLPFILLRQGPVYSISSVEEAQGTTTVTCTAQTFATAPADGYTAERHTTASAVYSGRLWRTTSGWRSCWYGGPGTVRVTYVGGRYADTATVDRLFKEAAILCLKNAWRAEQSGIGAGAGEYDSPQGSFPGFALPRAAREMLVDELRPMGIA